VKVLERVRRLLRVLSGPRRGVTRVRDIACCDTSYAGAYDWPLEAYRDFRVAKLGLSDEEVRHSLTKAQEDGGKT